MDPQFNEVQRQWEALRDYQAGTEKPRCPLCQGDGYQLDYRDNIWDKYPCRMCGGTGMERGE